MVQKVPFTIKIACFKQNECDENKCICRVGGIGNVIGDRLKALGINKAYMLRELTENMTKQEFIQYMHNEVNANKRQATWAYKSLYGCFTDYQIENKLDETCAKCKQ